MAVVTIELTGMARIHTGQKEVNVEVKEGMSWRDVIANLVPHHGDYDVFG